MTSARAILRGIRLALSSPRLLLLLWLLVVLAALPAGIALRQSLVDSIGASRVHEEIRGELEMGFLAEFQYEGGELESSVTPLRLSPLAPLENLEGWADGALFEAPRGLLAMGLLFALLWVFLLGGVIERLAGPGGPFRTGIFLGAATRHFLPLLGLTILSVPFYWGIYRLARSLFRWVEETTRDVTVEKTVLAWNLSALLLIVLLLLTVRMLFGYAKIAAVVEERRGIRGALAGAAAFVFRRPLRVYGVELGIALLGLAIVSLYALLAPGPGGPTVAAVAWAFAFGQAYLLARLVQRLSACGARISLYRGLGPGLVAGPRDGASAVAEDATSLAAAGDGASTGLGGLGTTR